MNAFPGAALADEGRWQALVQRAARAHGTPIYVYRPAIIERQISRLRGIAGGRFALRFAVKSNPNPDLLRWMVGRVEGLDVSSGGEMNHALRSGWQPSRIAFTGPAKTLEEIEAATALGLGSIVLEGLEEASAIDRVAAARGTQQRVLVRISPAQPERGFAMRMAGRPTQFGVDEEELAPVLNALRHMPSLHLAGFHVYSGSQSLDGGAISDHFDAMMRTFAVACDLWDRPIEELVFGTGLGIPYHQGDSAVDLEAARPGMERAADCARRLRFVDETPRLVLEAGRFLVGEAGAYVVRVLRVKESRGLKIAICDGGMNHNLGACGHLGGLSHRHYPMTPISAERHHERQLYRVVGPLCTTIDTLAQHIELPELRPGDLIAIHASGAYGPTASPLHFIGHAPPKEVLELEEDHAGRLVDASWLRSAEGEPRGNWPSHNLFSLRD